MISSLRVISCTLCTGHRYSKSNSLQCGAHCAGQQEKGLDFNEDMGSSFVVGTLYSITLATLYVIYGIETGEGRANPLLSYLFHLLQFYRLFFLLMSFFLSFHYFLPLISSVLFLSPIPNDDDIETNVKCSNQHSMLHIISYLREIP